MGRDKSSIRHWFEKEKTNILSSPSWRFGLKPLGHQEFLEGKTYMVVGLVHAHSRCAAGRNRVDPAWAADRELGLGLARLGPATLIFLG